MTHMKATTEMARKQLGYLKLKNKSYPIFEGLNVIGRDTKATVLLNDVKFSKLHAIISVVDAGMHLISDFSSANGTEVRNIKLIPYKFYPLGDRETIIFGDVVGIYYKGIESQNRNINLNINSASQCVDHDAPTQQLTENLDEQPTQLSINIHEAPTQQFPHEIAVKINGNIDIHEACTELLPNDKITTKSADPTDNPTPNNDISEAETQKDENNQESSKLIQEDHLDLSQTQVYDDIFANESFRLSMVEAASKYNVEVDETVLIEKDKSNKHEEDNFTQNSQPIMIKLNKRPRVLSSDEDDDIILSTQDNEMIEKKAQEFNNKKIDENSDDSATDIEDNLIANPATNVKQLNKNLPSAGSDSETDIENNENICEKVEKINESSIIKVDSASDKDIKDNLLITKDKIPEKQTEMIKNSAEADSDSETDVEEDLLSNLSKNTSAFAHNTNSVVNKESHDELETHKSNATTTSICQDSDDEEEIDLLAPVKISSETDSPNEKLNNNEIDDDIDLLAPTQLLKPIENSPVAENKDDMEEEDDTDYLAPTQLLQPDVPVVTNDDDILLAPTQLLHDNNKKSDKISTDNIQDEEDLDYLAPTQLLGQMPTEKSTTKEIQNDNKLLNMIENSNDDEYFLVPTQILEKSVITNNNDNTIFSAPTQLLTEKVNKINDDEDGDAFLAPTQKLKTTTLNKKSSLTNRKFPTPDKERKTVLFSEDILYLSPSDNIHDAPTQKLILEPDLNEPNEEDEILMAPTQQLTKVCNEINNDSELSYTDGTNIADESTEDTSMKLVLSESEESFSESLKTNENNTPLKLPDQQIHLQETETQLEVNFNLVTQKLYLEEKTSRPDNPLAHMFAQENTQATEQEETANIPLKDQEYKKLLPINSPMKLENSKITLKDIQEASTSKIKKSQVKLDRIKQEPTRRSSRHQNVEEKKIEENVVIPLENTEDDTKKELDKDEIERIPEITTASVNISTENSDVNADIVDKIDRTHYTRGKRISNYKNISKTLVEQEKKIAKQSEIKLVETNSDTPVEPETKPSENNTELVVKTKSNSEKVSEKKTKATRTRRIQTPKMSPSESDDFEINTRSTRKTIKRSYIREIAPTLIDFDDNTNSSGERITRKKIIKLDTSDESELATSNSSSGSCFAPVLRTPKRGMKIECSSSEEKLEKKEVSICLNTPNTKRRKYEPLNVTISNPQKSNISETSTRHKVVFTMLNNSTYETSVEELGGSVIDSITACTVLVTTKISRSLKFLIAIALGKPIVHTNWITDSIKANAFVDPWKYILEDKESEAKFNMSLKESLMKSSEKKLFSGIKILLAVIKNFDVLKEIIETSGGKCMVRAPPKSTKAIVVSYEEEKSKYSRYLKQKTLTVVSAEAIFSGVLQQKLNWNQYLLS